jgi:hypothetical protein
MHGLGDEESMCYCHCGQGVGVMIAFVRQFSRSRITNKHPSPFRTENPQPYGD